MRVKTYKDKDGIWTAYVYDHWTWLRRLFLIGPVGFSYNEAGAIAELRQKLRQQPLTKESNMHEVNW